MREYGTTKFPHNIDGDFCTDLMVMRSAAGFYLGRSYFDEEFKVPMPHSRESGYFATKEAAENALRTGFEVRQAPENAHLPAPHQPDHN